MPGPMVKIECDGKQTWVAKDKEGKAVCPQKKVNNSRPPIFNSSRPNFRGVKSVPMTGQLKGSDGQDIEVGGLKSTGKLVSQGWAGRSTLATSNPTAKRSMVGEQELTAVNGPANLYGNYKKKGFHSVQNALQYSELAMINGKPTPVDYKGNPLPYELVPTGGRRRKSTRRKMSRRRMTRRR